MRDVRARKLENALAPKSMFQWLLANHAFASCERPLPSRMGAVRIEHPGGRRWLGRRCRSSQNLWVICCSGGSSSGCIAFSSFACRSHSLLRSGPAGQALGELRKRVWIVILAKRRTWNGTKAQQVSGPDTWEEDDVQNAKREGRGSVDSTDDPGLGLGKSRDTMRAVYADQ